MKVIRNYYDNGNLEREYTVNGRQHKHGEYKEWYSDGQIWIQCHYKENQLHSEYKQWYGNGKLFELSHYKDGELDGEFKIWVPNGELWEHNQYEYGTLVKDYLKK